MDKQMGIISGNNPKPSDPDCNRSIEEDDFQLNSLELPDQHLHDYQDLVDVGFKNISFRVSEGIFIKKRRKLLDGITGNFSGGHLTAIMGPSGAGKTTLMNILTGYTTTGVTGKKLVNDEIRNEIAFRQQSCYIMQNNNLQPLLTVNESMEFAADLMSTDSKQEKQKKINHILETIGLSTNRKTRVDALSGGQKKRLSIALELLRDPRVMFFDEPTSGLDSLSSIRCIQLLKAMAQSGKTVICTIHQPSATIFNMFDHLYVVSNGKCIYQGSPENLLPYFEDFNLICPTSHNPADFLIEVASGEYGDFISDMTRKSNNGLNESYAKLTNSIRRLNATSNPNIKLEDLFPNIKKTIMNEIEYTQSECGKHSYPTSTLNQLALLTKRSFLMLSRDRTLTYSRLSTHCGIAIFLGILYYGIGVDAAHIYDNFSFMFFSVMFLTMTAFNCVVTSFPSELPIIIKEHFNKWYNLRSYYLAISISDITVQILATILYGLITYLCTKQPLEGTRLFLFLIMCILVSLISQSWGLIMGACLDVKNAVVFGPFFLLPFIIFSGFFIQLRDCPAKLKWMFHISFPKYALEGMVQAILGYKRERLPCGTCYCYYRYPEQFIKDKDMEHASYSLCVLSLVTLMVCLRIVGAIALSIRIRCDRR